MSGTEFLLIPMILDIFLNVCSVPPTTDSVKLVTEPGSWKASCRSFSLTSYPQAVYSTLQVCLTDACPDYFYFMPFKKCIMNSLGDSLRPRNRKGIIHR